MFDEIPLVILRHPQEEKKPGGTVPVLEKELSQCQVRTGLSWKSFSHAIDRSGEKPSEWAVLFLGTGTEIPKEIKLQARREKKDLVLTLQRKSARLLDAEEKQSIKGLILLDGNWKQTKTMWWRNSWLLKLRRLALVPSQPSRYSTIRRQPRRECLSSLESVALILKELKPGSKKPRLLLEKFQEMIP